MQNLLGKIKSENIYIIKTIKTIENHLVDEIDKDLEEKSYDEQDLRSWTYSKLILLMVKWYWLVTFVVHDLIQVLKLNSTCHRIMKKFFKKSNTAENEIIEYEVISNEEEIVEIEGNRKNMIFRKLYVRVLIQNKMEKQKLNRVRILYWNGLYWRLLNPG